MPVILTILLILLLICAIAVSFTKKILPCVLVFMFYSLITSMIWLVIQSPDLAITDAAVGAGITTVLYLLALKRIKEINAECAKDKEDAKYE